MSYVPTYSQPRVKRLYRHIAKVALTWGDVPDEGMAKYLYDSSMDLGERDWILFTLVARFKQFDTRQARQVLFYYNRSDTPCEVAFKRLKARGLIELVEDGRPGGRRGGSNINVWRLTGQGWSRLYKGRRPKAITYLDVHLQKIADMYVEACKLEQQGVLKIKSWKTDPDSEIKHAGVSVTSDLYMCLDLFDGEPDYHVNLEADLDNEGEKQIADKLQRYGHVYENRDTWPFYVQQKTMPEVLFFTYEHHVEALNDWIERTPGVPEGLASAHKLGTFTEVILSKKKQSH